MFSLHIGQNRWSNNQGSTHDLWKTCLEIKVEIKLAQISQKVAFESKQK